MPREKDSFRDHVKFLPDDRWKCNFCNKDYGGSVTRIKAHLAGVAGYGINDCKDVDGRVRSEARKALKGKGAAEPSNGAKGNVEEGPHLPVTANNEDAWREPSFAAVPYLSSDVTSTVDASPSAFLPLPETNLPSQSLPAQSMIPLSDCSFWPQQPQSQAGDSSIQPWNSSYPSSRPDLAPEALTNMPAPVNAEEGEPYTEVPQDARTDDPLVDSRSYISGLVGDYMPTLKRKLEELSSRVAADLDELETWCRKSKRIKDWSMVRAFREGKSVFAQQVERVDDSSKEVEEILGHCRFQKRLTTQAAGCRKSSSLVTTELVGDKSEETIKEICAYLMDDDIFNIGVYGMGGVGKTAILKHVHNKVLENTVFNDVFWVTVPQEFSIYELQDEIVNAIGLYNLSMDKDVERRASILNRHLKKKRAVFILDGLWMHFDFQDVGIPVEKGGIKLVLTTRSLNVCHEMLCQKKIEVKPLAQYCKDDWSLFREKLCFTRELPSEVLKIAKSIVEKCGGLPLGIIEIATRMRGVEELHEWKGMLRKLEDLRVELNVFKRLKLSYVNLGDVQAQQCFLHLSQVFQETEDFVPSKVELIESFIDEGLLDRIGTRQELHEQGNIILDKLRKSCLCCEDGAVISLHPLIRGMGLHIVRSTTHMVKAEMGLKEIPKEEFWTDHLEKVFLQGNNIKEISDGISPNCPKLMRLSLNGNVSLEAIHESFFKHLKGLKVLDLSFTGLTKLPDAISDLESLEALLLRKCEELRHIPHVRNLGSLRKLNVYGCAMLEEVPEGMEMLVKLSYLNLSGTKIETLPKGMLGKLVNLQYLAINNEMAWEERELEAVEGLYRSVSNVETFNACVRFLDQNSSLPYQLCLNESGDYSFEDKHERHIIIESCRTVAAGVDGEIGGDGHALVPKNVQVLELRQCDGMTSLCKVGPLDNLERLEIEEWEKLEGLGVVQFPHLRRLNVTMCNKLKRLMVDWQGFPRLQWLKIEDSEELEGINIAAPFLYSIEVYNCPKMKSAVEWERLGNRLPNLRSINIRNCEKLEEIIGGGPAVPIGATCLLTEFELNGCNNIKGVLLTYDTLLCLPFLQQIRVQDCKGIEVIIGTAPNMTQPSLANVICLTLRNLPELKRICDGIVSWVLFQRIHIEDCLKLKRLPLADNELSYPPPYLRRIFIDRLTWESLEYPPPSLRSLWIDRLTWRSMERDFSILVPSPARLVIFHDDFFNWRNEGTPKIIKSCDSIAARVDGEIGGDGRNLLSENVAVLKIGRGSGVTSLNEVGPLENLEELTIEEWEKLEEHGPVHFPHLRELNITRCSKLKHLLEEGQGLPRLQSLYIEGSEVLEGIKLAAPSLNHMEVSECPKMKRAVEWEWLANGLPNLRSIKIRNCEKLEEIIGGGPAVQIDSPCLLTVLEITRCNNMKGVLLAHDMLLHLPFLQEIKVEDCKGIEVIIGTVPNMTHSSFPHLTRLSLRNLPELESICDRIMSCKSIRYYTILNCPKLKRIPLQMGPLHSDIPSPPPSLRKIRIDRQTWQTLKWDYPLVPFSLEPFTEFFSAPR